MDNKKIIKLSFLPSDSSQDVSGKKPYQRPDLISWGDLRTLTLGGSYDTPADTSGYWNGIDPM